MKSRPLLYITIFFCIGIVLFKFISIPTIYTFIFACLFLILSILSFRKNHSIFIISILVLSTMLGGINYLNFRKQPKNHIANFLTDKSKPVYVEGTIVDDPEFSIPYYRSPKREFTLAAKKIKTDSNWFEARGLIRVQLFGPSRNYSFQDNIILYGNLERPSGPRNPGGFDWRRYLATKNIYAILTVRHPLDTIYLGRQNTNPLTSQIFKLRHKINSIVDLNLTDLHAKLLSAMITGRRYDIPNNVYQPFINTGTVHILSISGLHIVIIGFIFLFVFKLLRIPMKFSYILTISFLCGYAILSGARAPIVRSVIMMNVYLISLILEKDFDIWNALSIAALIILLFNPMQIYDVGFQLSFLTIISIIYLTPRIEAFLKFRHWITRMFSVSSAAWIGILPVVGFYFNIFSPVTVFANLLIVPITTVVMYVGFCFITVGLISIPLGRLFAQSAWLCLEILIRSVDLFNKLPFGHFYIPKPNIFFIILYFVLLLLLFERKRLGVSVAKFFIILLVVINIFIYKSLSKPVSDKLAITFLDVNHGDSIFIEFPGGGTMLVDGGERIFQDIDKGKDTVIPFLCKKGFVNIDAILNSHPHSDHLGGLVTVLENLKTKYVFDSGNKKQEPLYKRYKYLINKKHINYKNLKVNQKITDLDNVEILILNPPVGFIRPVTDMNNNSLVVKIIYKNFSILLTGDIEEKGMAQVLTYKKHLKSDIIKLPHHGSFAGPLEYKFLEAVSPKTAIISVGKTRENFPAKEVMDFLKKQNIDTYQTKTDGAIFISTDGNDYRIRTMEGI